MKLRPGDSVKGIYTIEKEFYAGGMGRVYLCKDAEGKEYVLKQPLLNGRNDDIKIEKLKVEANILKTLSHPYIVRYIDSFEEKNVFYLVIEYIRGNDLKTLFSKNPVEEPLVKDYCEQVLSALEYLHNEISYTEI